jgi:hypothetical protein
MKVTIQVVIEDDDMPQVAKAGVISIERSVEELCPETLGLKLGEAKEILAEIQTALVTAQTTRFQERQCSCPDCGTPHQKNGTLSLHFLVDPSQAEKRSYKESGSMPDWNCP